VCACGGLGRFGAFAPFDPRGGAPLGREPDDWSGLGLGGKRKS